MNRRILAIQLGLLGLGGGLGGALIFVGNRLGQLGLTKAGTYVGIVSIGAFALVSGIHAIVTKKVGFEPRNPATFGRTEIYTGLAAKLWGALFIAFAILLFILAGVTWLYPGGAEAFWTDFLTKPWGWGIILLGIGLTVMTSGFIRLMAGSAGYYTGLADLVERISGAIPFVLGLGMATAGLLLIIAPNLTMGMTKQMMTSIVDRYFR
ncbi:MAG: hypothetical protein ACM3TN_08140 [Alphaproteobacteria bacterium]